MNIIKQIFFISGIAALLLCGCSDSTAAKNRLKTQIQPLASQYISGEIYKQIRLNEGLAAYRNAANNIFVAAHEGLDVFPQTTGHDDIAELSVARFYAVQSLALQVNSAVPGEMVPIDHEKYTYRNSLLLKVSEKRSLWKHVPGTAISLAWLKNYVEKSAIQKKLQENVAQALPDAKYDIQYISHQKSQTTFRQYEVTVFAVYDPSVPGWVLEDVPEKIENILTDRITVFSASSEIPPPAGTHEYKGRFYWNNTHLYRKNYDNNIVFFQDKWLKKSLVDEIKKLTILTQDLTVESTGLPKLAKFMSELGKFKHLEGYSRACDQAVSAGEKLIKSFQDNNDRQSLAKLAGILQENPAFAPIAERLDRSRLKAESIVNSRHNEAIKSSIAALKTILKDLNALTANENLTTMQLAIIVERCKKNFQQITPENFEKFNDILLQLQFATLAAGEKWRDIRKLSTIPGNDGIWEKIRSAVQMPCNMCRRGKTVCAHCRKNPGKCSECQGISDYLTNQICKECRSSGRCVFCSGTLYTKCLKCSGRGFLIVPGAADRIIKESQSDINDIITSLINKFETTLL